MLMQSLKILGLVGVTLLSFVFNVNAQKAIDSLPKIQKINGITYEVLLGLAEITKIQKIKGAKESRLGYDEYEVLFRFVPMEGHHLVQILENKELEFKLEHRSSSVLVGPAFIKKMNLKVGTKYAMELFQTRSGGLNVRRYFYRSKAVEHQLYKAYDHLIDLLGETLGFDVVDSMLIQINKEALTGAEQRALMDAELKRSLDSKNFAKPQFTKAASHFLKEHSALLEEYEAAVRVLAQLEEKKYQEQLEKIAAEAKAAKELEDKIKAMKNETIPSVVNETKIVRGCYYEVVPGLAEVTTIEVVKLAAESDLKYDEHQVLFNFIPMEGHILLEELRDTSLEFFLYHRGNKVRVGPSYIETKAVHIGTRYAMTLYQKRNDEACSEQYTYTSKALDNDLFEAFPPKTIFTRKEEKELDENLEDAPINKAVDSSLFNSNEAEILIDSVQKITVYEAAKKDLIQAQNTKRAWRKKANEAIKIARLKARAAKKTERKEKAAQQKKNKGIQIGDLEVSTKKSTTYINKKMAIRNARKKVRLEKRKGKERLN